MFVANLGYLIAKEFGGKWINNTGLLDEKYRNY